MPIPLGILAQFRPAAGGGSYELIETVSLGTATASVSFSNLNTYNTTYQHLQVRYTARSTRANNLDGFVMTLNSDTAGNYSWHRLFGNGSSVTSDAGNDTYMYVGVTPDSNSTAYAFGAGVVDILDAYETSKNKTIRSLTGSSHPTDPYIFLTSGSWRNTNAITSITFDQTTGPNFAIGSRFSLYGLKGS